jgi:hypothetical protein
MPLARPPHEMKDLHDRVTRIIAVAVGDFAVAIASLTAEYAVGGLAVLDASTQLGHRACTEEKATDINWGALRDT